MTPHKDAIPPEDELEFAETTAQEASAAAGQPSEGLTEEEQNAWWMANVYRGHQMQQMTVRAIVTSVGIGALMAVSNLYVGLKTGWGLGVTITAAVIAYAFFKSLETAFPSLRKNPLSMLENCTILSSASAAGAISSAGLVSVIPALYLVTGRPMSGWLMTGWLLCVATLGLAMAIPLKRQLINIDKLAFPTGTATAETLRSLHMTGAKALQQAKTLLWCGVAGAFVKFWVEGWKPLLKWGWVEYHWTWAKDLAKWAPAESYPLLPWEAARQWLSRYAIGFEASTIFIAAGALMGIRVGVSMLAGMVIFFGVLGPWMDHLGVLDYSKGEGPFRTVVSWTLWPAVALMVMAGLTNFALRWRLIARALGELKAILGKPETRTSSVHVEVPMSWFVFGVVAAGAGCVILGSLFFGISWWMGVVAVLLTFVLSIVAARATGETDTTPIGAMGKITQLTYGVVDPGNMKTNLMTAGITAGAACHSGDLLQSLKTGYLVGANPRQQTIAQFFGILVGILVCVPVYSLIVRTPAFDPQAAQEIARRAATVETAAPRDEIDKEFDDALAAKSDKNRHAGKTNLLTSEYNAPSVAVWKSVAELLAKGVKELPPYSLAGMLIGGLLGVAISLLEEFLPKRYAQWVPSATGLGLAGVIMPQNSISMFLGAAIAWLWMKMRPKSCDDYMVSGASGLIAGESLTGVGINLVSAVRQLLLGG